MQRPSRRFIAVIAAALLTAPVWAERMQVRDTRDTELDQLASARRHKLDGVLTTEAKHKLQGASGELLNRIARDMDPKHDAEALAESLVRPLFPGATSKQLSVLTFYVLADAADSTTNRDMLDKRVAFDTKTGTHDLSRDQEDRLMVLMDRQSAFGRSLRAALNKIETVPDSLVKDLK